MLEFDNIASVAAESNDRHPKEQRDPGSRR
jgi:hypothetical protein